MKKIRLTSLLLIIGSQSFAQEKSFCCAMPSTGQFAMLASNDAFSGSHQVPKPYVHQTLAGKAITFKTSDKMDGNGFAYMTKQPSKNYLFVIHEWWGLNDHIKREGEKLFTDLKNVNVICLDLYDKKVADNHEDAAKFMQSVTEERALAIVNGAIAYAGKDARIATIGWCFGGGWSMQTALMAGKQSAACVMYYGMPEKDVARLKTLNSDVLFIHAGQDQWINNELVDQFENDMQTVGKKLIRKNYDADHAFANPSNSKFDEASTSDAYQNVMEFLRERMK